MTRNETGRPARKLQDKASGLGYNRDLIGVVQVLRSVCSAKQILFDLVNAARSSY
jgi:hypothetical protein